MGCSGSTDVGPMVAALPRPFVGAMVAALPRPFVGAMVAALPRTLIPAIPRFLTSATARALTPATGPLIPARSMIPAPMTLTPFITVISVAHAVLGQRRQVAV